MGTINVYVCKRKLVIQRVYVRVCVCARANAILCLIEKYKLENKERDMTLHTGSITAFYIVCFMKKSKDKSTSVLGLSEDHISA